TLGRDQMIQLEPADHLQDGFDMAVRDGFLRSEQVVWGDQGLVVQQAAEGLDFFFGPIGEIGQGALAGFLTVTPAFAVEDGGRGIYLRCVCSRRRWSARPANANRSNWFWWKALKKADCGVNMWNAITIWEAGCPSVRTCAIGYGIANGNWPACCGPRPLGR